MTAADLAIAEADRLRSRGFNCIAISNRIGHCPVPHAHLRDEGMSREEFVALARSGCHGLQVACGVRWGLAVVDLDGEIGQALWATWTLYRDNPPTWAVRTPRDGLQLWYATPWGLGELPSGDLWKGPGSHQGVEILADRKLAKCPPSYKVIDGERRDYAWLPGRAPGDLPLATLPRWVIEQPRAVPPRPAVAGFVPAARIAGTGYQADKHVRADSSRSSWRDVRDAVADKVALAERHGLRVVTRKPNAAGWIVCRSLFREDRHPSARFNTFSGSYWEAGLGGCGVMNFFDLLIALRAYPDFKTAVSDLERRAS